MLDNGDVREDLRVPEGDLGKEIESKFAAGEEMLVSAPVWADAFSPFAAFCVIVTHSLCFLFGRLPCFQLWAKNLQWLSNPWPNRKKDWAAQAATCYTLTNLLHLFFWFYLSPKLWPSQATSKFFCCDCIPFFFSFQYCAGLVGSVGILSGKRFNIVSVFTPSTSYFLFFSFFLFLPHQVFTTYIPEW